MTDDLRSSDLEHMPAVNRLIADRGMTFPNFGIATPACCPSRVSFLRGQYAHNHRVGYGLPASEASFREHKLDRSTVGTWASAAGYRTGYVGKYLNGYDVRRVPPGWDWFYANFHRNVWATVFNADGALVRKQPRNVDAHLGQTGIRFLARVREGQPFFLFQNFNAPHRDALHGDLDTRTIVPAPLEDWKRFRGVKSPRTPAFNRVNAGMHPEFAERPRLRRAEVREIDIEHRARLASLQVVDRQVRKLIRTLRETGALGRTYVFFTTDNGYHLGERRDVGKMTPLLSDVRVPLVVRGPGVPHGSRSDALVQNTDFAPTLAEVVEQPTPEFVDGRSMLPLLHGQEAPWRAFSLFEGQRSRPGAPSPTAFSGLTSAEGEHYVEYPDEFRELYDLETDPFQLDSLADDPQQTGRIQQLAARLEALRQCEGHACRVAEGP